MKKLISLLLILTMLLCMAPAASAADAEATQAAETLYTLGLFRGTGTNADGTPIFDLDKTPTRNQAIIMLVRLLGKENEALAGTWEIPFTDVTDAVRPYVGYAYANGLTNGYTATTYCGTNPIRANQYITFVLRALGYESGKDFEVGTAWTLSDALGITHGQYNASNAANFIRGDVTQISVSALPVQQKASTETLSDKLIREGVFTEDQYRANVTIPEEPPFTKTAFGDKWLHEYLLSLDPTTAYLGPDRPAAVSYFDQYFYKDRYIVDEIVAAIEGHYTFVRVVEATESGTMLKGPITNPGTRVETLEDDVYGRFIAVATFMPDGLFTQTDYYLRWRTDRP